MNALSRISAALRPRSRRAALVKARANALRRVSAALRPRGLVLILLPDATHWSVAVSVGGELLRLGHLDNTRLIQELHVTLAAQQAAIGAGVYVLERETYFTLVEHFDTVDSWLTDRDFKRAVIPAELVARARKLLPPGTVGEVLLSQQFYAARLSRP